MLASELQKGDIFTVSKPDPESPVRICLSISKDRGDIRFGFPNKPGYWCYMSQNCEVTLVERKAPRGWDKV